MDNLIIDEHYVTFLIHSGENIDPSKASELVRSALTFAGITPWPGMSIELFAGKEGETLVMASPAEACSAFIADYALPFFGLFTE